MSRWRAHVYGLLTVTGLARRGFFLPHRYAGELQPAGYPGLEPLFAAAEPAMRAVLDETAGHVPALLAMRGPAPRPRFDQDWFPRLDAAAAYALVRRHRPARIVEVGSGHSTRFLAQAVADGDLQTGITCLDPAPRGAPAGRTVGWRRPRVQGADPALWAQLRPGDFLFVDSSHLALPGTDVDHLIGAVLPGLAPGVLVHIHDVFLPDAYPEAWSWRGYNEQTVVAALLLGGCCEIIFASHWLATRRGAWLRAAGLDRLPLLPGAFESSLWLRRTAASVGFGAGATES
jgi:hypothetical protein